MGEIFHCWTDVGFLFQFMCCDPFYLNGAVFILGYKVFPLDDIFGKGLKKFQYIFSSSFNVVFFKVQVHSTDQCHIQQHL